MTHVLKVAVKRMSLGVGVFYKKMYIRCHVEKVNKMKIFLVLSK